MEQSLHFIVEINLSSLRSNNNPQTAKIWKQDLYNIIYHLNQLQTRIQTIL